MAKILMIDSNPEQQRALGGLLRYRSSHSVVMVVSCVDGARAAVSQRPDLIMINALMYMTRDFAFARVLRKNPQTSAIPILVHTTGALEDLTRRRLKQQGVAGVVELPVGAAELAAQIQQGLLQGGQAAQAGRPVQWPLAERAGETSEKKTVRPVNWGVDGSRTQRPPAQPVPPQKETPRQAPARPRGHTGGDAGSGGNGDQSAFRRVAYERVDASQAKQGTEPGSRTFQPGTWAQADPKRVVNPAPRDGSR